VDARRAALLPRDEAVGTAEDVRAVAVWLDSVAACDAGVLLHDPADTLRLPDAPATGAPEWVLQLAPLPPWRGPVPDVSAWSRACEMAALVDVLASHHVGRVAAGAWRPLALATDGAEVWAARHDDEHDALAGGMRLHQSATARVAADAGIPPHMRTALALDYLPTLGVLAAADAAAAAAAAAAERRRSVSRPSVHWASHTDANVGVGRCSRRPRPYTAGLLTDAGRVWLGTRLPMRPFPPL
jgi:hypothetical protein